MKFTKEQAVERLNQELTNSGKKTLRMSTRTLNEHTENLMTLVAGEEMELDDFVTKVKPMLENVNSNMEKDRSDFIKEYEKNHPNSDPKSDPEADPKPGDDDPNKALLERIAKLEESARKREEDDALASKQSDIRKYLTDNHVDDEKWIDSMLGLVAIKKDDDAEEKGKTLLELYNQSRKGSPITPLSPSAGGGNADQDRFNDAKAILKAERDGGK